MTQLGSFPFSYPQFNTMLYFLTGSIPLRFQIQRRRLVYLHHILNENKESLLQTFFEHQLKTRKAKDWTSKILKDIKEFEIVLSMDKIRTTPEREWKEKVKVKTIQLALAYLNSNVGSKSRKYTQLKMSLYLCPNDEIPVETAKFLDKTHSYMIEHVKIYFQQDHKGNLICNSCLKKKGMQSISFIGVSST